MPKIPDPYPPLHQICRNAGTAPEDIARAIRNATGSDIKESGVIAFLNRGTRNIDYLKTISQLTGLPLDVVSAAGMRPKNKIAN